MNALVNKKKTKDNAPLHPFSFQIESVIAIAAIKQHSVNV